MKKRLFLTLLLCFTILLSFVGCDSSRGYDHPTENGMLAGGDYGVDSPSKSEGGASSDRKIITTVNERVETETYDAFVEGLKEAVSEAGGYFVSSSYSGKGKEDGKDRYASFEIRVPAEKLSDFSGKVGTLGTVLSYKETANDVTLSYVDLESRISVLAAEETALLSILANASTTSEVLEIRKTLSDTQATLASLRAQKQTYDTLVAYSTVHLTVNEVAHARSEDGSFFSEVGDTFMASMSAIGGFFRGVGVFVLGFSPILLFIAAVGVAIFLLVRVSFRHGAKKPKASSRSDAKPEEDLSQEEKKDEK